MYVDKNIKMHNYNAVRSVNYSSLYPIHRSEHS